VLPLQALVSALIADRKWRRERCPVLLGPHAWQEGIDRWLQTRNLSPVPIAENRKSYHQWVAFNNVNRGPSSKYQRLWEEVSETLRPAACNSRREIMPPKNIPTYPFQDRECQTLPVINLRVEPPTSRTPPEDNNSRLRMMSPVGTSSTITIRWYLISSSMKTRVSEWPRRCKIKCTVEVTLFRAALVNLWMMVD